MVQQAAMRKMPLLLEHASQELALQPQHLAAQLGSRRWVRETGAWLAWLALGQQQSVGLPAAGRAESRS